MQTYVHIQRLIQHGARRIVVPGNVPMGCLPIILTLYASPDPSDYDRYGCLHEFNGLARYHNEQLRMQVQALRIRHPHTAIAFADYYQPVLAFLTTPALFGEITIHPSIQGGRNQAERCWCRIRREHDAGGVLRRGRRRRQVQLQRRGGVRPARRGDGVRRPVCGGELGRHPPHGGGVRGHRRGVAAGAVGGAAHIEPHHSSALNEVALKRTCKGRARVRACMPRLPTAAVGSYVVCVHCVQPSAKFPVPSFFFPPKNSAK